MGPYSSFQLAPVLAGVMFIGRTRIDEELQTPILWEPNQDPLLTWSVLLSGGEVKRKSGETFPQKNSFNIINLEVVSEGHQIVEKNYKPVEN